MTGDVLAQFDRIYADPEEVDLTALTATLPADFKRESQLVQWVTTAPASGSYVLAHS